MMRELKTFLAVVRFGTFASAGAHIGLTQSAVSAQIQRLEEDLGFPLFDRTGRSATLNAAGKQTVDTAEELLSVYAAWPPGAAQRNSPACCEWGLLLRRRLRFSSVQLNCSARRHPGGESAWCLACRSICSHRSTLAKSTSR